MSTGTLTLVFDGRAPTANKQRGRNNRWTTIAETRNWRTVAKHRITNAIRCHQIPATVSSIAITARQQAKDGRWHQDVAACSPTVKAVIDGFVDAGLIPKDTAKYQTSQLFLPCEVTGADGLRIDIEWRTDQ